MTLKQQIIMYMNQLKSQMNIINNGTMYTSLTLKLKAKQLQVLDMLKIHG
jgi:hypothetical protein